MSPSPCQESYLCLGQGLFPDGRHWPYPFMCPFCPASFHGLPQEYLLCSRPAPGTRILRKASLISGHSHGGVIALRHRGHIEEVSTESHQGGQGGHVVQPRFTRLPSLQLVKTAELDPSRNYLTGYHPHGIAAVRAFTNLCTDGTGFPHCSLGSAHI